MAEIWLRTNRRALLLGMILPAVLIAVGLLVALDHVIDNATWGRIVGWAIAGGGLLMWILIAIQMRFPRLAYADNRVLVYVQSGEPIGVPVEWVECFFLGSGTGQVPGRDGNSLAVRNLMMRIAEKAIDYQEREVKAALGRWEGGYVTIHGAWCEPLTLEVVQRLNARLAEAQRARREVLKP
jgi:hypothetical protein